MKPIILIGYMAVGKTTAGKKLAIKKQLDFLDTDAYIEEKTGRKIPDIFNAEGEDYFRELETAAVKELMEKKRENVVISVGGGLPVREENRILLKAWGKVIYLKASAETIITRVGLETDRPLLRGGDRERKIQKMLKTREPLYEAAADFTIITDSKSSDEVLSQIAAWVEKNS